MTIVTDATAAAVANDAARPAAGAAQPVPLSPAYRRYLLVLLLLTFLLSYLDRQIVTIMAEHIKRDLGLADWQLGAMTGLAFALFYTGLAIPIARLAERVSRPAVIAASMLLWSFFTMLCGRADTFLHLLLARIGVGFGEAGCNPAAHSLITASVPPEKRPSSLAIFNLGIPLGTLAGLMLGGLLVERIGWRATFLVAGAPGVLLAIVVFLTIREPRRAMLRATAPEAIGIREAVRLLSGKRSFWYCAFGAAGIAFVGYAHATFLAPFFLRVHGAQLGAMAAQVGLSPIGFLGVTLGIAQGVAGTIGSLLGGALADRLGRRDVRWWAIMPAAACALGIPLNTIIFTLDDVTVVLALFSLFFLIGSMWYGPVYTIAQSVAPPEARAIAAAIMMLIISVVGLGLGPITAGLISDIAAGPGGQGPAEGVRWALLCSPVSMLISTPLFWAARRHVRADMA